MSARGNLPHNFDGSLHSVQHGSRRGRSVQPWDRIIENWVDAEIADTAERLAMARLLRRGGKAKSAKQLRRRKEAAAAELHRRAQRAEAKAVSGRIETIGLTHYFVPDTKRGQRQFAAAMRRRFIGSFRGSGKFDDRFGGPSDNEFCT